MLKLEKMNAGDLQLPPGFRFHPTDDELVTHYLCRKCAGLPISVPIIAELDLYKFDPWKLPEMAMYGDKEWYFFSPRDRKYPNGSRPNRAAGSGYWKATGADKPIGSPKPVAIKKALVFYAGKAPKGEKSNWIMHEYRLAGVDRSARVKNSLRLDDWVLCRIYNKKTGGVDRKSAVGSPMPATPTNHEQKPKIVPRVSEMESYLRVPSLPPQQTFRDPIFLDGSDSLPRLHADSSCSEHVLSPEFTCDREVQSRPQWAELERSLGVGRNNEEAISGVGGFSSAGTDGGLFSPLLRGDSFQDVMMYLQKPF
ncbi:hypothetical protein HPP92_027644 [Vanilla planifolia]|uniref:NAC domain-containing protein n=1 Tax=Vanilla planifolia TaxID=51239 RepID=A0A835UJS7_VANPL|nr:hypothetical protein HPP92_027644 [Vanilla planifolia]KAG0463315.1 hypothetical protein HPP92_019384 [Vanilla planifolia]